jgi:nicotinamide mononucleotide transporter
LAAREHRTLRVTLATSQCRSGQGMSMSNIELFAAALGVLAVWLTVKQNPLCWPIGLVMVLIYSWIFYDYKLYSNMLLQVVYAGVQVYGWWQWTRGGMADNGRPVSDLGHRQVLAGLVIGAVIGVSLGAAMSTWSDATQPWLDAFLTGFSLVAQWWMANKRVQCWPLWIVLDVIFVGLFVYQGLYLTAGLYALFTLLAIQGWWQWRRDPAVAA